MATFLLADLFVATTACMAQLAKTYSDRSHAKVEDDIDALKQSRENGRVTTLNNQITVASFSPRGPHQPFPAKPYDRPAITYTNGAAPQGYKGGVLNHVGCLIRKHTSKPTPPHSWSNYELSCVELAASTLVEITTKYLPRKRCRLQTDLFVPSAVIIDPSTAFDGHEAMLIAMRQVVHDRQIIRHEAPRYPAKPSRCPRVDKFENINRKRTNNGDLVVLQKGRKFWMMQVDEALAAEEGPVENLLRKRLVYLDPQSLLQLQFPYEYHELSNISEETEPASPQRAVAQTASPRRSIRFGSIPNLQLPVDHVDGLSSTKPGTYCLDYDISFASSSSMIFEGSVRHASPSPTRKLANNIISLGTPRVDTRKRLSFGPSSTKINRRHSVEPSVSQSGNKHLIPPNRRHTLQLRESFEHVYDDVSRWSDITASDLNIMQKEGTDSTVEPLFDLNPAEKLVAEDAVEPVEPVEPASPTRINNAAANVSNSAPEEASRESLEIPTPSPSKVVNTATEVGGDDSAEKTTIAPQEPGMNESSYSADDEPTRDISPMPSICEAIDASINNPVSPGIRTTELDPEWPSKAGPSISSARESTPAHVPRTSGHEPTPVPRCPTFTAINRQSPAIRDKSPVSPFAKSPPVKSPVVKSPAASNSTTASSPVAKSPGVKSPIEKGRIQSPLANSPATQSPARSAKSPRQPLGVRSPNSQAPVAATSLSDRSFNKKRKSGDENVDVEHSPMKQDGSPIKYPKRRRVLRSSSSKAEGSEKQEPGPVPAHPSEERKKSLRKRKVAEPPEPEQAPAPRRSSRLPTPAVSAATSTKSRRPPVKKRKTAMDKVAEELDAETKANTERNKQGSVSATDKIKWLKRRTEVGDVSPVKPRPGSAASKRKGVSWPEEDRLTQIQEFSDEEPADSNNSTAAAPHPAMPAKKRGRRPATQAAEAAMEGEADKLESDDELALPEPAEVTSQSSPIKTKRAVAKGTRKSALPKATASQAATTTTAPLKRAGGKKAPKKAAPASLAAAPRRRGRSAATEAERPSNM